MVFAHAKESALGTDVPAGRPLGIEPGGEGRVEEPREVSGGSEESDAATHRHHFAGISRLWRMSR